MGISTQVYRLVQFIRGNPGEGVFWNGASAGAFEGYWKGGLTQPVIEYSKLTMETLNQGVKYVHG